MDNLFILSLDGCIKMSSSPVGQVGGQPRNLLLLFNDWWLVPTAFLISIQRHSTTFLHDCFAIDNFAQRDMKDIDKNLEVLKSALPRNKRCSAI